MNFLTELRDAEQKLGVPLTQGLEVTVTWERSPVMYVVLMELFGATVGIERCLKSKNFIFQTFLKNDPIRGNFMRETRW